MSTPAPAPLDRPTQDRLKVAAIRAVHRYPGPAGTILARELLAWADFGYRLGDGGAVMGLVDDLVGREAA